jgi:hypothetical protein
MFRARGGQGNNAPDRPGIPVNLIRWHAKGRGVASKKKGGGSIVALPTAPMLMIEGSTLERTQPLPRTVTETGATPDFVMPTWTAAARDRSMMRPLM